MVGRESYTKLVAIRMGKMVAGLGPLFFVSGVLWAFEKLGCFDKLYFSGFVY